MAYGWNMYEYAWHMDGICTEQSWNVRGIGIEYAWNMNGICMEHAWNMYRICTKLAWKRYGICVEDGCNMSLSVTDGTWRPDSLPSKGIMDNYSVVCRLCVAFAPQHGGHMAAASSI